MKTKIMLLALATSTMLLFQSCRNLTEIDLEFAKHGKIGDENISHSADTYDFVEFVFDSVHSRGAFDGHNVLSIDIQKNQLTVAHGGQTSGQCPVDLERLEQLRSILTNAQVCKPPPVPEGQVTCLAFAAPDVSITNARERVELAPVICNSGAFLCEGRDEALPSVLIHLAKNIP